MTDIRRSAMAEENGVLFAHLAAYKFPEPTPSSRGFSFSSKSYWKEHLESQCFYTMCRRFFLLIMYPSYANHRNMHSPVSESAKFLNMRTISNFHAPIPIQMPSKIERFHLSSLVGGQLQCPTSNRTGYLINVSLR